LFQVELRAERNSHVSHQLLRELLEPHVVLALDSTAPQYGATPCLPVLSTSRVRVVLRRALRPPAGQ